MSTPRERAEKVLTALGDIPTALAPMLARDLLAALDRVEAVEYTKRALMDECEALAAIDRVNELELERNDYATQLHALRWTLGLDTHEGEERPTIEASLENLRSLHEQAALASAAATEQEPT